MTLGHASMAFDTPIFFYVGLSLLIFGNGFFKPNISSLVGQLYANNPEKKDGAYTIFYMGINAGAFLGILLCGYMGEKVGWGFGFGLAGIFMGLGMVMFYLGTSLFGEICGLDGRCRFLISEHFERDQVSVDEGDSVAIENSIIKGGFPRSVRTSKKNDEGLVHVFYLISVKLQFQSIGKVSNKSEASSSGS
jgi:MFS family permease